MVGQNEYLSTLGLFNRMKARLHSSQPPTSGAPPDLTIISRHAVRLFAVVYFITNIYENLLQGILRRKPLSLFLRDLRSLSSFRLAAFISAYSVTYRALLRTFNRAQLYLADSTPSSIPSNALSSTARRMQASPRLAPFLAGVIASPTMLLEGRGQRRVTLALYTLTKAIQGGWEGIARKGALPRALREGRWWWGGHLIFAVSNAVLLHAFVFQPSTFPAAYSSFILKRSRNHLPSLPSSYPPSTPWPSPRQIVDGITIAARRKWPPFVTPIFHPNLKDAAAAHLLPNLQPILAESHPGHRHLTCAFLHPAELSCWNVFETFIKDQFGAAAKFFGVLSLLGTALRWRKFTKDPESGVYHAVASTITSSAFVSLSIGTAWSTICLFQAYLPRSFLPTRRFYIQGFLAGLWVSLVNFGAGGASRATDLGMYAARLAIQCFWEGRVKRGKIRNIRNGEVIYFALSMGALMSIYEAR
ncbi:hypothetical protein P7C70_g8248, partial [Phenoliferia sp. Uapishka_3]